MNQSDAIEALRQNAAPVRDMGATALFLFGSTVRDEAAAGSDVDLFIDYDPVGNFSLIDLVGIKLFLEDRLDTTVDVTTRSSLNPLLRERIERSAVRIF